jgi:hypothetical protein
MEASGGSERDAATRGSDLDGVGVLDDAGCGTRRRGAPAALEEVPCGSAPTVDGR